MCALRLTDGMDCLASFAMAVVYTTLKSLAGRGANLKLTASVAAVAMTIHGAHWPKWSLYQTSWVDYTDFT